MKSNLTSKTLLSLGALALAPFANANTTLLTNVDFAVMSGDDLAWIALSNTFIGGVYQATVTDAYEVADRVTVSGDGAIFSSWDDELSDTLENFLFQEFGAGPAEPTLNTTFSEGDVIVFKGSARATRTGTDTSDMKVRAFIKTLGYNDVGWAFQTLPAYTAFHDIGSTLEPFELSITFPDSVAADPFQVIQLGFEITNSFDGTAMDSGTIYFENLEGYIEGDAAPMWKGFPIEADPAGWVDTGEVMGWLYVENDPYIYSQALDSYFFMASETDFTGNGNWFFVFKN